ncbi:MAG TPA: ZIP family metal transporter [Firmicutes bacterium]|nr:ZIP family metal transporter [Bacillota bacterium]
MATVIGFAVGLFGTGIGGCMAGLAPYLVKDKDRELVGFSGGMMLGIVLWDLYPEAVRLDTASAWGGILAGIFFIILLRSRYKPADRPFDSSDQGIHFCFTRAGMLLGLGIAMHNLPEGVAVGAVFAENPSSSLWKELALLMAAHNIPEGLAVATTLKLGGISWQKVTLILSLTELPMGVGALMGGIIGRLSPLMTASALGFAAGAMLFLVGVELLPLSWRGGRKKKSLLPLVAGLLAARALIFALD